MRTSAFRRLATFPSFGAPAFVAALVFGCLTSTLPSAHAAAPPVPAGAKVFDFEADKAGKMPAGFTPAITGSGGPMKWITAIARDAPSGEKMLTQLSSEKITKRYLQAINTDISATDVDISVKFRTIRGEMSATGGIIFRHQDNNNYYVIRASSGESNVVAFKTENGRRVNLGVKGSSATYGVHARVSHRRWHTLRVIAKGSLFTVYLNDKKLFDVENETFIGPGSIGVWTKSDSVTEFDDLTVAVLKK
ncbi:MAG: hypothetical protein ACI9VS_002885 [Candidatus Binatia bacterium]|jgi:hypothetical protein